MASYASAISGMGLGTYGALKEGKQTSDLLDSQAATQRENAKNAIIAAKANADKSSLMATRKMGGMTAAYSASGVDLGSGSVLAVMAASAGNAELDRQTIIHGGDIRAVNFQNQATMDELGAKHALQASYFNALSSLTLGSSKMAGNMGGGGKQGEEDYKYDTDYSAARSLGEGDTYRQPATGGAAEDEWGNIV